MGSYRKIENNSSMIQPDGKISNTFPLARQSSIYSMTFNELQTVGGLGWDYGSMNMEDLLKNIWTAEGVESNNTAEGTGNIPTGSLQRQGSLTLPRTLSQRIVDEVWKDLLKESTAPKAGSVLSNLGQGEPTLGELTLEEFLARAGVVREDNQPFENFSNVGFYGGGTPTNRNSNAFAFGFQQTAPPEGFFGDQIVGNNNVSSSSSLCLNNSMPSQLQQHQQSQPQLQPLFPKRVHVALAPQLGNNAQQIGNSVQLASPRETSSVVGIANSSLNSVTAINHNGIRGMAGLRGVTTYVAGGSPGAHLHPDVNPKSSLDTSSLSPSPYAFDEGGRGRRSSGTLEKQVERRRRRMIKNRESAARSRARKQAYTLELEAEVDKLKELNKELQKRQAELIELQKAQLLESLRKPLGSNRTCLRRTLTGPW